MQENDKLKSLRSYFAGQIQQLDELIKEKQNDVEHLSYIKNHLIDHLSSNTELLTDSKIPDISHVDSKNTKNIIN